MREAGRRLSRLGHLLLMLVIMVVASLTPLLLKEGHLQLVQASIVVEYEPIVHPVVGIHKMQAAKRLIVPPAILSAIIMILPPIIAVCMVRMLIWLVCAIMLLRKQIMLRPLKYSSNYVGTLSSSPCIVAI